MTPHCVDDRSSEWVETGREALIAVVAASSPPAASQPTSLLEIYSSVRPPEQMGSLRHPVNGCRYQSIHRLIHPKTPPVRIGLSVIEGPIEETVVTLVSTIRRHVRSSFNATSSRIILVSASIPSRFARRYKTSARNSRMADPRSVISARTYPVSETCRIAPRWQASDS
jgi:hypothetical protein